MRIERPILTDAKLLLAIRRRTLLSETRSRYDASEMVRSRGPSPIPVSGTVDPMVTAQPDIEIEPDIEPDKDKGLDRDKDQDRDQDHGHDQDHAIEKDLERD